MREKTDVSHLVQKVTLEVKPLSLKRSWLFIIEVVSQIKSYWRVKHHSFEMRCGRETSWSYKNKMLLMFTLTMAHAPLVYSNNFLSHARYEKLSNKMIKREIRKIVISYFFHTGTTEQKYSVCWMTLKFSVTLFSDSKGVHQFNEG